MGIIILTTIAVAWVIYPVLRLQYEQQREVRALETELQDLKSRNDDLRDQVEDLKTPEGVEQLARDSLGLVKPGETAYVVTGGTLGETTATALPTDETSEPLWQQALDVLFGFK